MIPIKYRIKTAEKNDIINHLNNCSSEFVPKLVTYVDIQIYSQKIFDKAITFEAWNDNDLIGLIAVYLNNSKGFITNISVDKSFKGLGVFKGLINLCFDLCKVLKVDQVDLEIYKKNKKVIDIYKHIGFNFMQNQQYENRLVMFYKLN